ncbi:MAG TPA: hypothetical protein VNN25_26750 [Thermoanaerobaculia bacterium]|nr:hypothetical protein [Thermoanaerobaculia bacterium]
MISWREIAISPKEIATSANEIGITQREIGTSEEEIGITSREIAISPKQIGRGQVETETDDTSLRTLRSMQPVVSFGFDLTPSDTANSA